MLIIFCSNPLELKKVDVDYQREHQAAQVEGFEFGLVDFEELLKVSGIG